MVLLAGTCATCAGAPPPPAAPPAEPRQTELAPRERHKDQAPPIIAPPPAYGNKVVMARRSAVQPL
jgi:hypothetical protein